MTDTLVCLFAMLLKMLLATLRQVLSLIFSGISVIIELPPYFLMCSRIYTNWNGCKCFLSFSDLLSKRQLNQDGFCQCFYASNQIPPTAVVNQYTFCNDEYWPYRQHKLMLISMWYQLRSDFFSTHLQSSRIGSKEKEVIWTFITHLLECHWIMVITIFINQCPQNKC